MKFLWYLKYYSLWKKATLYDPIKFDGFAVFDANNISDVIKLVTEDHMDDDVTFTEIKFIDSIKIYGG